jgi:cardiolipin synthase
MLLLMRARSRSERRSYLRKDKPIPPSAGNVSMAFSVRDNWGHRRDIEQQYMLALKTARKRIVIANAYFFPGYRLLRELRRASLRGIKVTLILQGQPDMPWVSALSRLLYSYLIRSGVEIREYCQRPLHGKVAIVDNEWATVGSSNLDPLSLSLNMEANLLIKNSKFNSILYDHLINLGKTECKPIDIKVATRGYWWRTPLIFLSFHFLRYFPTLLGWLPAHTPTMELIMPHKHQRFGKSPGLKELVDDEKITADFKSIKKNIYDKEEI